MIAIDLDAIRDDTPGCQNRIHFNNAGASIVRASVHYYNMEGELARFCEAIYSFARSKRTRNWARMAS